MKKIFYIIIATFIVASGPLSAQDNKFTFSGLARTMIANSAVKNADTINPTKNSSGNFIVDFGINIAANQYADIKCVMRLSNAYGGFYGQGASVQFRELYVRGLIYNKIKYQVGNIHIGMSPFTLYNNNEYSNINESAVFGQMRSIFQAQNFNDGNLWWLEGAQAESALLFPKGIQSLKLNGFITRNRTSDFLIVPQVLQNGLTATIVQSKYFTFTENYISLFSLDQTANSVSNFANQVLTSQFDVKLERGSIKYNLNGEAGTSKMAYKNDVNAPNDVVDNFYKIDLGIKIKDKGLQFEAGYRNVGAGFESSGAQSLRMNYNGLPSLFSRVNNSTNMRSLTLLDVLTDANLYNQKISEKLQSNAYTMCLAEPFGVATPNRKGFEVEAVFVSPMDSAISSKLKITSLSEIEKFGTQNLRKFMVYNFSASIAVNKLLKMKQNFVFNTGAKFESTNRAGDSTQSVNMQRLIVDAGFEFEFFKKLDFLIGSKLMYMKGNEFFASLNNYNEINGYTKSVVDQTQMINGVGLRYTYRQNAFLSLNAYGFDLLNTANKASSFNTTHVYLIFNMKF